MGPKQAQIRLQRFGGDNCYSPVPRAHDKISEIAATKNKDVTTKKSNRTFALSLFAFPHAHMPYWHWAAADHYWKQHGKQNRACLPKSQATQKHTATFQFLLHMGKRTAWHVEDNFVFDLACMANVCICKQMHMYKEHMKLTSNIVFLSNASDVQASSTLQHFINNVCEVRWGASTGPFTTTCYVLASLYISMQPDQCSFHPRCSQAIGNIHHTHMGECFVVDFFVLPLVVHWSSPKNGVLIISYIPKDKSQLRMKLKQASQNRTGRNSLQLGLS